MGKTDQHFTVPPRTRSSADDLSQKINEYIEFEKKVVARISQIEKSNQKPDIQSALMRLLKIDDPLILLDWDWASADFNEVIKTIRPFIIPSPQVVATLDVGKSIIPNGTRRKLEEVKLKVCGEIWVIHKTDSDPFPSNPHAHNAESGLKLDLSSGKLYLQKNVSFR